MISALIEHENAIAGLYDVYEECTGESPEFWHQLVREENAHAYVLQELQNRFLNNEIYVDSWKFNLTAIKTAIEYIKLKTEQARQNGISYMSALVIARDVESTILEHDFFRLYKPQNYADDIEIESLAKHTAEHLERIIQEIKRVTQE